MPFFDPGNGSRMYIPKSDWNRGTYRELRAILNELPEEYLDQTATILVDGDQDDDYHDVRSIGFTGPASQVLDPNHFYMTISA